MQFYVVVNFAEIINYVEQNQHALSEIRKFKQLTLSVSRGARGVTGDKLAWAFSPSFPGQANPRVFNPHGSPCRSVGIATKPRPLACAKAGRQAQVEFSLW